MASSGGLPVPSVQFDSDRFPTGLIPRVELTGNQVNFVRESPDVEAVMVDLDDAETLVHSGHDSSWFGRHVSVVTTSTIHDDTLALFRVEREAEAVREFRPRWHIPCDRPVYVSDDPKLRRWKIEKSVEAVSELQDRLVATTTQLIPLIKGVNADEWGFSIDLYRSSGYDHFAYYAAQYFGRARGRRRAELIDDTRTMVANSDLTYLLLIGLQSPRLVPAFPPAVQGFAGMAWRIHTKPGSGRPAEACLAFRSWKEAWKHSSSRRQSVI